MSGVTEMLRGAAPKRRKRASGTKPKAYPMPAVVEADLSRFVEVLFQNVTDRSGVVALKGFDDSMTPVFGARPVRLDDPRLVDLIVLTADQTARHPGVTVYAPPACLFQANRDGRDRKENPIFRAGEAQVAVRPALSIDGDQFCNAAQAILEAVLGVQVTLRTISGGRWTNPDTGLEEDKTHLHFRYRTPASTPEELALATEAAWLATKLVRGDMNNIPACHPMRWPGSVWNKDQQHPRLSAIVEENEDSEITLEDAVAALRTAWLARKDGWDREAEGGLWEAYAEAQKGKGGKRKAVGDADYEPNGDFTEGYLFPRPWIEAAVANKAAQVAGATPGNRHRAIIYAGGSLGEIGARGPANLEFEAAFTPILNAAVVCGAVEKYGEDGVRNRFVDGWNFGLETPRPDLVREDEPEPLTPAEVEQARIKAQPAVDALIERFNALYYVVNENGKAVIFEPGYDEILKRRRVQRQTVPDLKLLYLNESIEVGSDGDGRPVIKKVADVWLNHPKRRQYVKGVKFDPTNRHEEGVLNLWEGFALKPAPGDWSLLRGHVERVICGGDPVRFRYLMGWMARLLQYPNQQGEVAVVMKGGEGCGKGTLAKSLMGIIGHHALAISNAKHLVGNFNSHLRDCVFLFADEAFFAGDRSHVGVLKSIITEAYITVEGKYQNAAQSPNFLHVMMASNEDWVVPASMDSRRFFVLDVGNEVTGNLDYFDKLNEQLDAGGREAMLHDLLAYDLRGFNVRAVPQTAGLQDQRKLSLGTTDAWWVDCLARGFVYQSQIGLHSWFGVWETRATMDLLFLSYSDFARKKGERRPLSREDLGRFMARLGARRGQWRQGVIGEHMTDVTEAYGTRRAAKPLIKDNATGYYVGTLAEAKDAFTKATGLAYDWDFDSVPEIDELGENVVSLDRKSGQQPSPPPPLDNKDRSVRF